MGANKISVFVSQYTDPFLKLEFKEKKNKFYIPRFFLKDQVWYSNENKYTFVCSERVGHTFIHFLYTGEYQTLEIDDENMDESKTWMELRVAVQVLLTLSYWRFPKLEELVHSKIESLSKSIYIYDTLLLVDEELENAGLENTKDQEEWLENFLMTSLNVALEDKSVACTDLSIFKKLRHIRLIQFFATKFFKSFVSQVLIKNEDDQNSNVESQDTDYVSAMILTPTTSSSDEFESPAWEGRSCLRFSRE
ncbi:hypothetical protein OnM2_049040 [Erysiphe neolycopersici]|uniref:BTB domain-containing protein n=1 Tax=Erysiphe neolycopersici TaxID=212602 RepID=A0A420HTC8_9PEZI|nr:hypothetical protein OnM2_049040 [Erysiphe neolycopersici]